MSYTKEQTEKLVAEYTGAGDKEAAVEALAVHFDKSKASIIAKLSAEGVYERKTVKGKRILKADVLAQIADELGVEEDDIDFLEKVTVVGLRRLLVLIQQR